MFTEYAHNISTEKQEKESFIKSGLFNQAENKIEINYSQNLSTTRIHNIELHNFTGEFSLSNLKIFITATTSESTRIDR